MLCKNVIVNVGKPQHQTKTDHRHGDLHKIKSCRSLGYGGAVHGKNADARQNGNNDEQRIVDVA